MSVIVHKTSDFAVMQDGDRLSILEFSDKFVDSDRSQIQCPVVVAGLGKNRILNSVR